MHCQQGWCDVSRQGDYKTPQTPGAEIELLDLPEAGEEPEITGDLTNVGMLRKDGLKAVPVYISIPKHCNKSYVL